MHCPICGSQETIVMDYLQIKHWVYVVTRRMCRECGRVYSTGVADGQNPHQVNIEEQIDADRRMNAERRVGVEGQVNFDRRDYVERRDDS